MAKTGSALSNSGRVYVYDEAGRLLGEYDTAGARIAEHVWLGGMPVATIDAGGAYYAVLADHLGTPRQVIDTQLRLRWRWDNREPFGYTAPNQNPDGLGAFAYNLRFPGHYFDAESGLHYNYFRDYDPWLGRYVESDPVGLAGGLNTYAYVYGNPANWIDPYGLARHHVFPQQFWKNSGMSKEVKKIFNEEIVNTPGPHNNTKHPPYNKRAGQIFEDFCDRNNITDPNDITPNQAEDFLDELKNDPEIDAFNKAQGAGTPLPYVNPLWKFIFAAPFILIETLFNNSADTQ